MDSGCLGKNRPPQPPCDELTAEVNNTPDVPSVWESQDVFFLWGEGGGVFVWVANQGGCVRVVFVLMVLAMANHNNKVADLFGGRWCAGRSFF